MKHFGYVVSKTTISMQIIWKADRYLKLRKFYSKISSEHISLKYTLKILSRLSAYSLMHLHFRRYNLLIDYTS